MIEPRAEAVHQKPRAEAVHQKRVKLSRRPAATTPCEILHKCNCRRWSRRWDRYVSDLPNTRAKIYGKITLLVDVETGAMYH